MAFREGSIAPTADPAAALLAQIEGTLNDHTGQWEFVEEVTVATIPYRIWRNRGSGVTNPNSFGSDFYCAIYRGGAQFVRMKCFEVWDATNKKAIRPVKGSSSAGAPNANGSWGDEVNGYTIDSTSVTYFGPNGALSTTGLEYYIRATKDQLNVYVKFGTTDDGASLGLFESLMTSSPSEPFPLYAWRGNDTGMATSGVSGGISRMPTVTLSQSSNFQLTSTTTPLQPTLGGINNTDVDRLHGDSILVGRPRIEHGGGATLYGQYRGQAYDWYILAQSSTARNGDTVTLGADVYVRATGTGPSSASNMWMKRDAT
jgi:hypothetical protein